VTVQPVTAQELNEIWISIGDPKQFFAELGGSVAEDAVLDISDQLTMMMVHGMASGLVSLNELTFANVGIAFQLGWLAAMKRAHGGKPWQTI